MFVQAELPDLLSAGAVQAIDIAGRIAEEDHGFAGHIGDGNTGADLGFHGGGPVDATGGCVQRVYGGVLSTGEDAAAIDRGLRTQNRRVREGEGPLHLQARQIIGGEPGVFGGLEARVGKARSPTAPTRAIAPGRASRACVGYLFVPPFHGHRGAEKIGYGLALVYRERRSLLFHDARLERFQNGRRCESL
ncbi:MAG: hypothetical protein C5B51_27725 [Terriglobia bacterium]|nr:MAG: hypothetical protein C5B51_27725 [Terriglobia bacterium]